MGVNGTNGNVFAKLDVLDAPRDDIDSIDMRRAVLGDGSAEGANDPATVTSVGIADELEGKVDEDWEVDCSLAALCLRSSKEREGVGESVGDDGDTGVVAAKGGGGELRTCIV